MSVFGPARAECANETQRTLVSQQTLEVSAAMVMTRPQPGLEGSSSGRPPRTPGKTRALQKSQERSDKWDTDCQGGLGVPKVTSHRLTVEKDGNQCLKALL
eukprot:3214404-Amphidinium_carterae.2